LYNGDLELVFVELPKFTKQAHELLDLRDKWLYFLQNADDLRVVPDTLQQEPPIAHAFEIANQAGLTQEEELAQRQRVDWIQHVRDHEERVARNAQLEAKQAAVEKVLLGRQLALTAAEQVLADQQKAFADEERALADKKQAFADEQQAWRTKMGL
jgi:hypothetical protein